MLQTLYRGLTTLGGPAIRLYLTRRRHAGKEDPVRQGERLGIASLPRPDGRLIWFHAASVGESLSILVLVRRLLDLLPAAHILVTTGTVTSAALMARRLPARAIHQYVPVDGIAHVRGFLDHWRPDVAVWIESEIWPNLVHEVGRRGIPAALINARMSERSFRRWRRVPGFAGPLMGVFRLTLAQTRAETERLAALGARNVRHVGNLKFSADPLPVDETALADLTAAVANRPVWLFASTHPGEEAIAADVHRRLSMDRPDLLTLIVPRHPSRGAEVAALVRERGLTVSRRTETLLPKADDAVHIADTMGELGLFFRLSPVTCVGGSFVPIGGHNPIEPAQLGSAILYGPHMTNFPEIAAEMEMAGGAVRIADADDLGERVRRLLGDEAARRAQTDAAAAVAASNRQVVDRVIEALRPLLADAGIEVAT